MPREGRRDDTQSDQKVGDHGRKHEGRHEVSARQAVAANIEKREDIARYEFDGP
eukprot:CAMPEP_0182543496 /NCGR_PEP_ID=MMETSP1323-20130603/31747_1 /TAXON_ID=236787 /ORGANISM="Florenciella parvula, Strain RCC1693" /LENGTH=53 /DNA_ID=CAMNT_0024754439 /DNA_START=12 /DNA_END=170 /DNA_ORIENTATION=+